MTRFARRLVPKLYRLLVRSPLAPILRSKPVQRLKQRFVSMPAERVQQVMEALGDGDVRAWVVGGWGIDALVGEQTRPHSDLDVIFETDPASELRALERLEAIGFRLMRREQVPGRIWSERIALSDGDVNVVDLHPIRLHENSLQVERANGSRVTVRPDEAFTRGTLAGREVPCISAKLQQELHSGYEPEAKDHRDLSRLRGE